MKNQLFTKIQWVRPSKPLHQWALTICLSGVLASGIWLYLERATERINSQYTMTTVLKTKKYIRRGQILTPALVEEVAIPVAFVQPKAIQTKSQLKKITEVDALKARIEILEGEQIVRSKFYQDARYLSLAYAIEPEKTALTLKLKWEDALGGMVRPGDGVNVLWTMRSQAGWPHPSSEILMQDLRVVAVNNMVWDPAAPPPKNFSGDLQNDMIWVTLSLSLKQAAKIRLAESLGHIGLVLRSPMTVASQKPVRIRLSGMK